MGPAMFTFGVREPSRPSARTSFNTIGSDTAGGWEMRAARHAWHATYTPTAFFAFQPT